MLVRAAVFTASAGPVTVSFPTPAAGYEVLHAPNLDGNLEVTTAAPVSASGTTTLDVSLSGAATGTVYIVIIDSSRARSTPPVISSIQPSTSFIVGQSITLVGSGLAAVVALDFAGTATTFAAVDDNHITVTVPGGISASGVIHVLSPFGLATSPTYNLLPQIDSISASTGWGGDVITLTGQRFAGVSAVRFNGVSADSFNFVNSTTVTAVVPTSGAPTAGPITITTGVGTSPAGPTFTPNRIAGKKVMAIGDSITNGTYFRGAWRYFLEQLYRAAGLSPPLYVGSQLSGPTGSNPMNNRAHEGYPGLKIEQVDAFISTKLSTYTPDIAIMHLGTNNAIASETAATMTTKMTTMVDHVLAGLPSNGILIVFKIIDINGLDPDFNVQIQGLNASLDTIASTRPRMRVIDAYTPFTASYNGSLFSGIWHGDYAHPNAQGYDLLAYVAWGGLDKINGGANPLPTGQAWSADLSTPTFPVGQLVCARWTDGELYTGWLQRSASTALKFLPTDESLPVMGGYEDFGSVEGGGHWAHSSYGNLVSPVSPAAFTASNATATDNVGTGPDGAGNAGRVADADVAHVGNIHGSTAAGVSTLISTWVRDTAGNAPTSVGSLISKSDGSAGTALGSGSAWRRVFAIAPDNSYFEISPAGRQPGPVDTVSAVGAVDVFGMNFTNTFHYGRQARVPIVGTACAQQIFCIPRHQLPNILDANGDLDVSGTHLTEPFQSTYASPIGDRALFVDAAIGQIQLVASGSTWTVYGPGAVALLNKTLTVGSATRVKWRLAYKPSALTVTLGLYLDGVLTQSGSAAIAGTAIGALHLVTFAGDPRDAITQQGPMVRRHTRFEKTSGAF